MYYSELELNLKELFFSYKYTLITVVAIILILLLVLLVIISLVNKSQNKKCKKEIAKLKEDLIKFNESNSVYLRQFTTQLERIAKALEQEPEPYVIESDDEKH